jgi:hypothetical protein
VYVDAVNFGDKAISVKGVGKGRAIIKAPADPPAPGEQDPCAGAGLCWSAPDGPVKVGDLTTVGHANGILGLRMDGMLVARTSGRDHDEYGIAAFESHRLSFVHNTERGDGGEAGIYIGDTDDADARVAHNTSTGWTFGFFFRDSRVGTAWDNKLAGNCIGALVLDTGLNGTGTDPETHQEFTNHPAGAWLLVGNRIVRNTRFCPAEGEGEEGAPPVGGHGVAVIGADHVRILHSATGWTSSGTSWAAGSGSGTTGAGPRPRTASATDPGPHRERREDPSSVLPPSRLRLGHHAREHVRLGEHQHADQAGQGDGVEEHVAQDVALVALLAGGHPADHDALGVDHLAHHPARAVGGGSPTAGRTRTRPSRRCPRPPPAGSAPPPGAATAS